MNRSIRSIRSTLVSAASMTPGLGLLVALLGAASYLSGLAALFASSFLADVPRTLLALAIFLTLLLGSAWLCGLGAGHLVASAVYADDTRRASITRAFGLGWTAMVAAEVTIGCGIPWLWEAVVRRESQPVILLSLVVGAFVGAAWAGRVTARAFAEAREWRWTVASAHVLSLSVIVAGAASASIAPSGWLLFLLVPFAYALPIAWQAEASRVEA